MLCMGVSIFFKNLSKSQAKAEVEDSLDVMVACGTRWADEHSIDGQLSAVG